MRAERIKESYHTAYHQPASASAVAAQSAEIDARVQLKNNYNGIGIRMGVDTQWKVYRNFSLYGDGAASILYGQEKLTAKDLVHVETQNNFMNGTVISDIARYKNTQNSSRAIFDLDTGIHWDQMFGCGKYHLGLHVGWAFRYFVYQNQLMKTNAAFAKGGGFAVNGGQGVVLQSNSYFSLQGLVIGGQFDF